MLNPDLQDISFGENENLSQYLESSYKSSLFDLSISSVIEREQVPDSVDVMEVNRSTPDEIQKENKNSSCESCHKSVTEQQVEESTLENLDNIVNKENVFEEFAKPKETTKKRKETQDEKRRIQKEKLDLKEPCDQKCRKKCSNNFTKENRVVINNEYKKMDDLGRKRYILSNTKEESPQIHRKYTVNEKHKTVQYSFQDERGNRISVCKIFFLTTLGFNKKNDRYVFQAISRSKNHSTVTPDMRGRLKKYKY